MSRTGTRWLEKDSILRDFGSPCCMSVGVRSIGPVACDNNGDSSALICRLRAYLQPWSDSLMGIIEIPVVLFWGPFLTVLLTQIWGFGRERAETDSDTSGSLDAGCC